MFACSFVSFCRMTCWRWWCGIVQEFRWNVCSRLRTAEDEWVLRARREAAALRLAGSVLRHKAEPARTASGTARFTAWRKVLSGCVVCFWQMFYDVLKTQVILSFLSLILPYWLSVVLIGWFCGISKKKSCSRSRDRRKGQARVSHFCLFLEQRRNFTAKDHLTTVGSEGCSENVCSRARESSWWVDWPGLVAKCSLFVTGWNRTGFH